MDGHLALSRKLSPASMPTPPSRRRGGQPGNANARKHGLYSARRHCPIPAIRHSRAATLHPRLSISNSLILQSRIPSFPISTFPSPPSPTAALSSPSSVVSHLESAPFLDLQPFTAHPALDTGILPVLSHYLDQNRLQLLRTCEITRHPLPLREMLAWSRAIHKLISEHITLQRAIHRLHAPPLVLSRLARHLPRLVCLEFAQPGIPEERLFVPRKLENNDANSPLGGPVLTDSQWALIGETLESLREELDSRRKYRRHIPRPDARLLIQGIILKLAFGIAWNDLPDLFRQMVPQVASFPLRAARELYRQLYLSGQMAGIYHRLAWHLRLHGGTTPDELVESRIFLLDGPRIYLAPGAEFTWQAFTALLLLQRAFHNYRVFVRERTLERRRRSHYLRSPRRAFAKHLERKRRAGEDWAHRGHESAMCAPLRPNPPVASRPSTDNRLPITVPWPPPRIRVYASPSGYPRSHLHLTAFGIVQVSASQPPPPRFRLPGTVQSAPTSTFQFPPSSAPLRSPEAGY